MQGCLRGLALLLLTSSSAASILLTPATLTSSLQDANQEPAQGLCAWVSPYGPPSLIYPFTLSTPSALAQMSSYLQGWPGNPHHRQRTKKAGPGMKAATWRQGEERKEPVFLVMRFSCQSKVEPKPARVLDFQVPRPINTCILKTASLKFSMICNIRHP